MGIADIESSDRNLPPGNIEFQKKYLTNTPTALAMLDRQLFFVAVTERFLECYGLLGLDVVGRHVEELFGDMPSRWRETLSRVMAGESLRCDRDLFMRADGSAYWLRWEALPYRDADEVIAGGVIFLEMLTNEIDAENNLRFVLDSAEIGIWERDFIRNKITMTAQSEKLLGYVPGTVSEDPLMFESRVHPEDSPLISSAIEQAIQQRSRIRNKFRVIWPDGSIHWLCGLSEFEYSTDGQPIRLRGASFDITETQQQEIDLKELTSELERKVEERTQALQEATEAKSRFLANMSHEIRNPLNSVTILAKLLESGSLSDEKRKDFVHRISTATNTVTQILDEILDFTRIEAGQTPLDAIPFYMNDLLDEIRALFEPRAEDKGIKIEIPPTECNCTLLGDKTKLKQILNNLIGNAVKFTDVGTVKVCTRHERRGDDLLNLTFDISDTGIGIEPDILPTLFRPFTQADNGITRKYGGTGLGLSICKSLASLMGGEVEAVSTPGLGSVFSFIVDIPIQELCDPLDEATAQNNHKNCLREFHVLIVDDDIANTEVTSELLQSFGAITDVAYNGLQAIEIFKDAVVPFDAVLMDIQMPVMDGIEATRRIRKELQFENLPIIAVTAGVLPEQQQEALAAGMTALLRKPVDNNALISALLRYR
jgi:two-component system, sensor histidine kinase and response regulator